jgi:parallel beta-helix repeat protein
VKLNDKAVAVAVAATLILVAVAFAVNPGTTPDPARFEDTVKMGMSDADLIEAEFKGYEVPKAQVFYSQYSFVVGYNGVEAFARYVGEGKYERVWGVPTTAYVTDFSGTNPSPANGSFVEASGPTDWTNAGTATYVVGGGPVLPFSSEEDAEKYADEHGGETVSLDELLSMEFEAPDVSERADAVVETRSEEADSKVQEARELLDREVSVVVGEDTETVQAAVDAAPPNTSVRIPEGLYNEHVVVDKPVTLVGENGTQLVGYGNGTVISVEADRVGVSSLNISGVGNKTSGEPGHSGGWDESIEEAYGSSDAAISFNGTDRGLVHGSVIDTNATGVIFFDTQGGVVSDTTVYGAEEWVNGFMGVLTIRSPAVVQSSSFYEGRDSVYSHASDGLVVRDNYMDEGRFGVHLMYTSDTMIRNNTVRDKDLSGIIVMTSPVGNYVVNNDARDGRNGISTAGSRSYFADNVVVNNTNGLRMGARASVYTRNVIAHNENGARATSIIPSNKVSRNDFIENDIQVTSTQGSMRIWGDEGAGNYWSNAPPNAEQFRPTDPVDSSVTSVDGMVTVRESSSYTLMRSLETVVPGMRSSGLVDEQPLEEPTSYTPELLEETR